MISRIYALKETDSAELMIVVADEDEAKPRSDPWCDWNTNGCLYLKWLDCPGQTASWY
jgi:hypothetical protein